MGQSKSKNQVESVTKSFLDVVTSTTQSCVSSVNQNQVASFRAKGGIINVGNIDWDQVVTVKSGCALSDTTKSDLDTSLQQQAQQMAAATNSAFGINLGSQKAINVAKYTTELATAVKNSYEGRCANIINQNQTATFESVDGGVLNVADLNWSQTQHSILDCIQSNEDVITAKHNLEQEIGQTSKTSVSGLTFFLIFIVIGVVLVLIIGVVIFFLLRTQKNAQQFASSPEGQALIKTGLTAVAPQTALATGASGLLPAK